ncbi:MAG TPA: LON peptidase substrate-binding domain-containing protein [Chloroflexota bacterium]|nr:LON peptidase substrate-binding domain-containing protein [Chloroflexota bacterium]
MTDNARELPLFPLNTVLFPSLPLPLHIFEERYKLMIGTCVVTDNLFGVCLIKEGVEVGGPAEPFEIGTVARIAEVERLPDGRMNLMTFGQRRFRLEELIQREPYLVGRVVVLEPDGEPAADELVTDVADRLLRYLRDVRGAARLPDRAELVADVDRLSYLAAATLGLPARERQSFLETDSAADRLQQARDLLRREIENARLFGRAIDGPSIGPFSRN